MEIITRPIIIAHKGASGHAPENTLRSFQQAIEFGSDMIELDLRETLDGELVCIHDSTVDRTTNGSGDVHTFTYQELRKLNAGDGECIPLLEDVLKHTHHKLQVNIDLKVIGVERRLLELVEHYEMLQDTIISSFFHGTLVTIRNLSEHIATAILFDKPIDNVVHYALDLKVNAINPNHELVTKEIVQKAHQANLKVYPWTVNDTQIMKQIFNFGIDGLITDYPDRAIDVLKSNI